MPRERWATKPEPNVSGNTTPEDVPPKGSYKRDDFLRDLKKVVRKLPPAPSSAAARRV